MDNRPRPDQAHLALDDVPELRKLIQTHFPQNSSHPGNSRIVLQFLIFSPFLEHSGILKNGGLLQLFRILDHLSELPNPERPAVTTQSALREKYRPSRIQKHKNGNERDDGKTDQRGQEAKRKVDQPLRKPRSREQKIVSEG